MDSKGKLEELLIEFQEYKKEFSSAVEKRKLIEDAYNVLEKKLKQKENSYFDLE